MVSIHFLHKIYQKSTKRLKRNKCPIYMELFGNKIKQKTSNNYYCEKCNFNTVRKSNYDRHILTSKHLKEMYGTKNEQKTSNSYSCKKCNYNTVRKSNYDSHILTSNHKAAHTSSNDFECDNCSKIYQTSGGLWKHKKKCVIEPSEKGLIMNVLQQNKELNRLLIEQNRQNSELHEKVIELCKNSATTINSNNTNSHNKIFNLQFFLNETCKGAMNLTDFVDSVVLQLSDLDDIGNAGFIKGMSNIIISNLNSLAENKRPIHCTDVKREVMYVRDSDKWEKDANKEKMRWLIKKMDRKLAPLMTPYTLNHQKVYRTSTESNKHQQILFELFGGGHKELDNEDIIIQNISKKTTIDRQNHTQLC